MKKIISLTFLFCLVYIGQAQNFSNFTVDSVLKVIQVKQDNYARIVNEKESILKAKKVSDAVTPVYKTVTVTSGNLAADFTVGGISYAITSSTAPYTVAVTKGYTSYSGSISIPSSVTNNGTTYLVTSIGDFAFKSCNYLTSVSIPTSVISIGTSAFLNCSGLTSVSIPASVTSIGDMAFGNCSGLKSVTLPSSITSIGRWAFEYCTSLTSVTIPSSVTTIERYTFRSCKGLTSVSIPASVTSIGDNAFEGCAGLKSVALPSSITSIGSDAFLICTGLMSVNIPSSVISIGQLAFQGCTGLTAINVETGNPNYSSVDGVLFDKAQTILICYPAGKIGGSYTIPSSVTSVKFSAFQDCKDLMSVNILSSVLSIGDQAFLDCTGLTAINIEINNPNYLSVDGVLFDKNQTVLICYPAGKKANSYTISSSVISVVYGAFCDCTGLTSVTLPSSISSIRGFAFKGCTGLTDIYTYNINSINTILKDDYVFYNVPTSTCVLHVPAGSGSLYAAAAQWKDFTHILEDLPSAVNSVGITTVTIRTVNEQLIISGLAGGEPLAVYTLQGVQLYRGIASSSSFSLALPTHGIYVVKAGAESVKVGY